VNDGQQVGFVLDLGRCVGCGACVLACRLESAGRHRRSPKSPALRRVLPLNDTRHSGGPTWFLSVACHHCERPACVRRCPSGAYERRADGVVLHHEALCVGCRYCEMACPFGAPRFDPATGIMAKCDFCEARATHGDEPACVVACPTEALRLRGSGPNSPNTDLHDASVIGELSPDPLAFIPGFLDAAACRPATRFKLPHGVRGHRLHEFMAVQAGPKPCSTDSQEGRTRDQGPGTRDRFHEWPLVVFTALAIPAAGVFAAQSLAGIAGAAVMPTYVVWALAATALVAGLASSLAHLGRPLRAPLALRRAGRNALGTEVALASALIIIVVPALLASFSPPLRLALARAAGVLALGLLAALGFVYFLPARWPWRTLLATTSMTSGLAIGAMVVSASGAWWWSAAAVGLLLLDTVAFAATWLSGPRFGLASPPYLPVYPGIHARRRPLVALRVLLVDLLPATLLLAQLPALAAGITIVGIFVDRFAFYGLACVASTEAAIADMERAIWQRGLAMAEASPTFPTFLRPR